MSELIHTCEDNMQMMARLSDKFLQLGILDPEYGIGEGGKNHKSRNTTVKQKGGQMRRCPSTNYERLDWDNKIPQDSFFDETERVFQNRLIFGANYFPKICGIPFKTPRRGEYEQFIKDYPVGWIIWDKVNGTSDFNDCELIWTSFDRPTFVYYFMWAGMMQGSGALSGKRMNGNKSKNQKRIHPTEKPVILYKYLLFHYANEGDRIGDTNSGSGSLCIACYDYGFNLWACEKYQGYFNKAELRIRLHTSQNRLFI